ncbi:hypothetical protein B0T10DRAFT_69789 [Thelonectria olida]|uniref:Uncharacterized protein n=1 Tax=Thelonectria olida TaxID=1576542 RepID=A0A9P9ANL1_9HYPO|nr:hypothetical protein B0T10DRAFT_69789 [Thelonectria olida]
MMKRPDLLRSTGTQTRNPRKRGRLLLARLQMDSRLFSFHIHPTPYIPKCRSAASIVRVLLRNPSPPSTAQATNKFHVSSHRKSPEGMVCCLLAPPRLPHVRYQPHPAICTPSEMPYRVSCWWHFSGNGSFFGSRHVQHECGGCPVKGQRKANVDHNGRCSRAAKADTVNNFGGSIQSDARDLNHLLSSPRTTVRNVGRNWPPRPLARRAYGSHGVQPSPARRVGSHSQGTMADDSGRQRQRGRGSLGGPDMDRPGQLGEREWKRLIRREWRAFPTAASLWSASRTASSIPGDKGYAFGDGSLAPGACQMAWLACPPRGPLLKEGRGELGAWGAWRLVPRAHRRLR